MRLTRIVRPVITSCVRRYNSNLPKFLSDGTKATFIKVTKAEMFTDLKELIIEADRRKYNTKLIGLGCLLAVIVTFFGAIKNWATDQAADVTKKYLENPKFKEDITRFAEQTISDLGKSEQVQTDITNLLGKAVINLAEQDDIRDKLAELFANVFKTETVKNAGGELSEDVVKEIIMSEKYATLRDEVVKYVVEEMIRIVNTKELQNATGNAAWTALKVMVVGSSSDIKQTNQIVNKT